MSKTKVKICGISNLDALRELIELKIDFIGFIFHQNSPRNVDDSFIKQIPQINFKNSRPVCVFVNSEKDLLIEVLAILRILFCNFMEKNQRVFAVLLI